MNEVRNFVTDDIALAAYLVCMGGRLIGAERKDERTANVMVEIPEGYSWVEDYYGGKGVVDPMRFHSVLGRVKRACFDALDASC